jgi:hypothetical protein
MIDGGLSGIFRERFRRFHWQRIESMLTGNGIPDSNYCVDGIEGWIEWKKTDSNRVPLRPDQVGWHLRRARAGGRTFIAIRKRHNGGPRLGAAVDSLYLYRGADARNLVERGLVVSPLGRWDGGPARWHWPVIETLILK